MSFEVHAITGRLFTGTITKVRDSAFTDGTEIQGIEQRTHRLVIYSGGMDLRAPDPEYTPLPSLRDSLTFELSLDIRTADAAAIAMLMDEVDSSSGAGVVGQQNTPKSIIHPTRAIIIRPLAHTSTVRYLYGPRWAKMVSKSDCNIEYGPNGPHMNGTVLTLRATVPTTATSGTIQPAAAWTNATAMATLYGNLSAGS